MTGDDARSAGAGHDGRAMVVLQLMNKLPPKGGESGLRRGFIALDKQVGEAAAGALALVVQRVRGLGILNAALESSVNMGVRARNLRLIPPDHVRSRFADGTLQPCPRNPAPRTLSP